MKKKLPQLGSLLLALALIAGLLTIPASAAWTLPSYVLLDPGEFIEIQTEGLARDWTWSCSDETVVECEEDRWTCGLRGLKPGTATVTVVYTMDNGLSPISLIKETCTVIVKDPATVDAETPSKLEPLVSFGTVGEDISGTIDGAKGFNHGFLPVRRGGLWGLANADMKLVVPFQYTDLVVEDQETRSNTSCAVNDMGYMAVCVDGRDYIIDWRGNVIYAASGAGKIIHAYLHEGYFTVRRYFDLSHLDKYETEYYDFSGREITKAQATALQKKAEAELARLDEAHGDLYYRGTAAIGDGIYVTHWAYGPPTSEEKTLWIPINGSDRACRDICEELLVLYDKEKGKYGAISVAGLSGVADEKVLTQNIVIPFEYDYLHDSREGYVSYQKGSEFGLLKNPVNPPKEAAASVPGAAPTPSAALPKVGEVVTSQIEFRGTTCKAVGLTPVTIDGYQGYVKAGDILAIPCIYQFAGSFREDLKVARVTLMDGTQNLIDQEGKHLLKQNYDNVSETLQGEILAYDFPPGATKTEYLFFDMNGNFLRSVKDVPIPKWAQR